MKLWLLRHGEAGSATRDAERELTPRGWRDAGRIGEYLHRQHALPQQVLVSPLVRARQTLEAVSRAFPQEIHPLEEPRLVPDADPRQLLAVIEGLPGDALLVGHNPILSQVVALLVEGLQPAGRTPVLGTANLVLLEGDCALPGCMALSAVITPDSA